MSFVIKDFSTGYDRKQIIHSLNLVLNNNEWLGIIGANGSGKSTFLKGIGRILKPFSGTAIIGNKNIHNWPTKDIAKEISFLPQIQNYNLQLTVYEFVCLGRSPYKEWWNWDLNNYDKSIVLKSLRATELCDLQDVLICNLSGGQRQRAYLALALAQEPQTLLLDEPTTFLDINYQIKFLNLLKILKNEKSLSIITVIHDINLALRFCDRIAILKNGKILALDKPKKILTKELIKEAFGVEISLINTPIGLQICILD